MSPLILPGVTPAPGANTDTPGVPHMAWPFTLESINGVTQVQVNEQDTLEDIFACVQAIVSCPAGAWADQPTFGIPPVLFAQAPLSATGIERAIVRAEPRAATVASEYPALYDAAVRNVRIDVGPAQTGDQ